VSPKGAMTLSYSPLGDRNPYGSFSNGLSVGWSRITFPTIPSSACMNPLASR
jgi:hypothetical protein